MINERNKKGIKGKLDFNPKITFTKEELINSLISSMNKAELIELVLRANHQIATLADYEKNYSDYVDDVSSD